MTQWLKQSTAVTVKMGPFVDSADGTTAETGLTIQKADVRLSKNGGDYAAANADQGASDAGAPHDELGEYDISLNTTDTNTLGRLRVIIKESGALAVWSDFMVVPANVWDSLFGADKLQVHVDEMTAGIITATVVATGAIDADALATDAVDEIVDQTWRELANDHAGVAGSFAEAIDFLQNNLPLPVDVADEVWASEVDGSTTAAQSMRLQNSALAGKASGMATTTATFRDLADTKDRITATVDSDGNRTAVTLDAT